MAESIFQARRRRVNNRFEAACGSGADEEDAVQSIASERSIGCQAERDVHGRTLSIDIETWPGRAGLV